VMYLCVGSLSSEQTTENTQRGWLSQKHVE
jgi:hypothetical protein